MDETRRSLERNNDPHDPTAWAMRLALCRQRVREGELELVGTTRKHFVVREVRPVALGDGTYSLRGYRLELLSRGVYCTKKIEGALQVGREPTMRDWNARGLVLFLPLDPPHAFSDVKESMRELELGYFGPRQSYWMDRRTGRKTVAELSPRAKKIRAEAPYFPVILTLPEAREAVVRQPALERPGSPLPASPARSGEGS